MTNLYLVKSPLQLLNAIEASEQFEAQEEIIIIKYSENKKSNMQLANLLELKKWGQVIHIEHAKAGKSMIEELKWIRKLSNQSLSIEKIFIGDYRSNNYLVFAQNLNCKEIILLDDGTATFYIQEKFLKDKIRFSNGFLVDTFRKVISKIMGLKTNFDKTIHLFSCYNLDPHPHQKIYKNKYSFMKRYIENEKLYLNDDLVLFIGAKYIEAGWMEKKDYFESLKRVFDQYTNKKLLYVPHRGEDKDKLNELAELFHFEIKHYDTIIELGILQENNIPKTIIGFTSSALVNFHKMYADIHTISYKIALDKFSKLHSDTVKDFYLKFESSEQLNVVNL